MKIMITGLSGNLSSALVKAFPENEFKFDSKDCTFSKTEVPFTYDVKYKKELDIRNRKKIDKYMQYKPDILTMDITMPNMDGIEALREIMSVDKKAKVIMISAAGQQQKIIEAIKIGAQKFITKPFEPHDVVENINGMLK